ncbi:cuticle protein 16.5-like [Cimex lectularius]|uniref:CPR type cuticle protein n=1 Tax=Cimex lectularius TaxID=79782 RepID=A0A8I6RFM4_CIMLE|nr:cuticle protein 16.5-like [Cimex lectularius]
MYTQMVLVAVLAAVASAAPGLVAPAPLLHAAPAAPFVTAHSSQVVTRNHNGVVAPLVPAAPLAAYLAPAPLSYAAAPFPAPVHPLGTGVAPFFPPAHQGLVF